MADATQQSSWSRIPWLNIFAIAAVVVAGSLDHRQKSARRSIQHDPQCYPTIRRANSMPRSIRNSSPNTKSRRALNWRSSSPHGGSSRQARNVIDGSEKADVVTLGSADRCRCIAQARLDRARLAGAPAQQFVALYVNDRLRRPQGQSEEHSRLAGPHQRRCRHRDAEPAHLRQRQIERSRGLGLRHDAAAAVDAQALAYLKALFQHVAVFDTGARGAATSFTIEKIGDVHLTWENEALREVAADKDEFEIVYPPVSIRAEPAVAWSMPISRTRRRRPSPRPISNICSPTRRRKRPPNWLRPIKPEILARTCRPSAQHQAVPDHRHCPITAIAKDWDDAREKFFADNGIVDTIAPPKTNENQPNLSAATRA